MQTTVSSMILFEGMPALNGKQLATDFGWRWPDLPPAKGLVKSEHDVAFSMGAATVGLGSMPVQVPSHHFETRTVSQALWPTAPAGLVLHQSHLAVTVTADAPIKPLMTLLTQITTSTIVASKGSMGVFWESTPLLISSENFLRYSKLLPSSPVELWVDINVGPGRDGRQTGYTTGLATFGVREIEAVDVEESPDQLRARIRHLADQLLITQTDPTDGAVVGQLRNSSITAQAAPSLLGRTGDRTRLVYDGSGAEDRSSARSNQLA